MIRNRVAVIIVVVAASTLAGAPRAAAQFSFAPPVPFRPGDGVAALAAADIDRDGDADLVLHDEIGPLLTVFLGDGLGSLGPGTTSTTGYRTAAIALGDVDGDGRLDAVLAGGGSRTLLALRGDGTGGFAPLIRSSLPGTPRDAVLADLDGDGVLDVASPLFDVDAVAVGRGNGRGAFSIVSPPVPAGQSPHAIAAADFDADGRVDLAVANRYSGDVSVLANRGGLAFVEVARLPAGLGLVSIVARDLDGDGVVDVAALAQDESRLRLFFGDGALRFDRTADLEPAGRSVFAAAADLDVDGVPDLVVAPYAGSSLTLFRGEGRGRFASGATLPLPPLFRFASAIAAEDFDGDAIPDLAVAVKDDGGEDVALYFNRTPPACIGGNVGAGAGQPIDVLFVNDSAGTGPDRAVNALRFEPFTIFMSSPPGESGPVPFALYAWTAARSDATLRQLPRGIGRTCLPMPPSGGAPAPLVVWNTWGRARVLGAPTRPATGAPSIVLSLPSGAGRPARFFLQGLVRDARSPSGRAAVTNGITVEIR